MFNTPEHKSYIALCRDLWLERQFEEGDWYAYVDDGPIRNGQKVVAWFDEVSEVNAAGPDAFWLPRLDQWLGMLEEAGEDDVQIQRCGNQMEPLYHAAGRRGNPVRVSNGPTREEACARLWMAVNARTGTPT